MAKSESDIDTDRIVRAIDEIQARQRPASGEHVVAEVGRHESRIMRLETRMDDCEKRLAAGDTGFAEVRKDVAHLTEKVGELSEAIKSATRWVLTTVGAIGVAGVVYAVTLQQAAQKAGQ